MYRIRGLRSETDYQFQFSAVNDAGWGEPFTIGAKTETPPPSAAARLLRPTEALPRLLIQSLASMLLCFALLRR